MEQWRQCGEYPDYEVSNYGRVRQIADKKFISPVLTGVPKYFYVNLHPDLNRKDRKSRKLVRVHRLVAKEWCPGESYTNKIVDHRDINPYNNNHWNLRWTDSNGNSRNMTNNLYVEGVPLKDYCHKYENPSAAYAYLFRIIRQGIPESEAVCKYDEYLECRVRKRVIEREDKEV